MTLQGLNGLQGDVKIETFNLPNNDPAGGIQLTLQTNITNVSYCQASRIIGLNFGISRHKSGCNSAQFRSTRILMIL